MSSTVSLKDLSGLCSETGATSRNDAPAFISIKVEEGTDIHTQPKEIPVPISFPAIKAEQDESTSNEHQHIHDVDRPYPRSVFSKTSKQQSNLHGGRKLYTCDVCNKSFTRHSHLKVHQCTHSGERPFMCGVCNKSFRHQSHLKEHQRTHSGQRPYMCGVCSKSFIQHSHLKVHQYTPSGECPFTSGVSTKSFADQGNQKVHHRAHSAEHSCT